MKKLKIILTIIFVLFIVSICYAASPGEQFFSADTKEWLKIISGFITIGILPLITIVFNQGKKEILIKISSMIEKFENHWHDIECENTSCGHARTGDINISQTKHSRHQEDLE